MEEKERNFANKYQIRILDTNKRAVTSRQSDFFKYSCDKDIIESKHFFEEEPLYTITIPKSKLDALLDIDEIFYNCAANGNHRRIFETIMEQKEREIQLRRSSAAIKNAFEAYSLLLHLHGFKTDVPL